DKVPAPLLQRARAIVAFPVNAWRVSVPANMAALARLLEHAAASTIATPVHVDHLRGIGAVFAAVHMGVARLAKLLMCVSAFMTVGARLSLAGARFVGGALDRLFLGDSRWRRFGRDSLFARLGCRGAARLLLGRRRGNGHA